MKQRAVIIFVFLTLLGVAWACRYSVRDTGFVDLGDEPYQLVLAGRDLGARAEIYRRISAASLLDANITFSVREETATSERTLTLVSADGRRLLIARGDELPTEVSAATALIESVALSPLRAEIHEAALNAFAVVILIEGGPAAEVARVQTAAEAAIRAVTQLMPSMPKPVDTPPKLIPVTAAQAARERVTLWGLGFDPELADEPRVALVFGRGRRIGSPLEGPLITQTVLQERLVIIGQDCECELDREWMKGQLLPARWDADRQRMAVQRLGFDPENPMVRAEVSRIVMRGPVTGQVRKLPGAAAGIGYAEIMVEDIAAEVAVSDKAPPTANPSAPVTPATVGTVTPLETTSRVVWMALAAGAVVLLLVAVAWWRKIRREQG
ncbi:MAG: hypothetical protein IH623_31010 [Verrucomicrobia bacterium]|nr:hypothetical protein [Verrucomicrobiota bacterium]